MSRRVATVALAGLAALVVQTAGGVSVGIASSDEASWRELGPSLLSRGEVGAARVGPLIYVVGGFENGFEPSKQVERFDPATGNWGLAVPLPTALNHATVVGHGGKLYVFGGYYNLPTPGEGRVSASLFRYDPAQDSWLQLSSAPVPRAAAAAGVIGGRLYVAGGATDTEQAVARTDVYDFARDRWTQGPDLPTVREHVAGAVAGRPGHRKLYALGGRDGVSPFRVAERLSPRTGKWKRLADMDSGHAGFAAVGLGRRVVAFGGEAPGETPTGTIAATELYRPGPDRWTRLPDMPTPRHGLGGVRVGGRIYAIEGGPVTQASGSKTVEELTVR
jgi:hypothetical protein